MKHVSILVPESSVLQSIADPQYLFSAVNHFMIQSGRKPLFDVRLVGAKKEIILNDGLYSVHTEVLIDDVKQTDLIIIPALFGDMEHAISLNKKLIPWIVEKHQQGAEVASLCMGAFLFASTGLLNGKKCSTHWGFANQFRSMFPEVALADGRIVTEENRLYSSGGAISYWNLLLHLVEKYTDRQMAIVAAKYFAIDIDRNSQTAFAMFQGQKAHTDAVVKQAQEFIEQHIEQRPTVEELAMMFGMGRRTFERRFKQATNNSVLEYMQRIKMEAAKRNFESSRKNINEVMYDVGYTDTKAFRTTFKKVTGLTPVEYRNKYNKQVHLN
ncbi:MAG: helix-turn-helix domain-containing protein [Cyclobacteriaceae bacterium]|nr:helix-turn-helix domain-containing protein [Cyclobacteriaceae bacterium]UYN87278.1 MAG: helix-turn-helix domain-containing protein [Cyclobacteriaceae bacterium]